MQKGCPGKGQPSKFVMVYYIVSSFQLLRYPEDRMAIQVKVLCLWHVLPHFSLKYRLQ